jgi:hypothetical protein
MNREAPETETLEIVAAWKALVVTDSIVWFGSVLRAAFHHVRQFPVDLQKA